MQTEVAVDPDIIIGEFTEVDNDDAPGADSMSITVKSSSDIELSDHFHYRGRGQVYVSIKQKKLGYHGCNNIPFAYRNHICVYIDMVWHDWLIGYALKLQNPGYLREIESQGMEIKQLTEASMN